MTENMSVGEMVQYLHEQKPHAQQEEEEGYKGESRSFISRSTSSRSNRRSGSGCGDGGDNGAVDDDDGDDGGNEHVFDGSGCMEKKLQLSEEDVEWLRIGDTLLVPVEEVAEFERQLKALRPGIVVLQHPHMIQSLSSSSSIHDGAVIESPPAAHEKTEIDPLHVVLSIESMDRLPQVADVQSAIWVSIDSMDRLPHANPPSMDRLPVPMCAVQVTDSMDRLPLPMCAVQVADVQSAICVHAVQVSDANPWRSWFSALLSAAREKLIGPPCAAGAEPSCAANILHQHISWQAAYNAQLTPQEIVINSKVFKQVQNQSVLWSAMFELACAREKGKRFAIQFKVRTLKFGVPNGIRKKDALGHFVHEMEMKVHPPKRWASTHSLSLSDTVPCVAPHIKITEQITTHMSSGFNLGFPATVGINVGASSDRTYSSEIENYKWITTTDSDENVSWTWSLQGPWKRSKSGYFGLPQLPFTSNVLHFGGNNLNLSATWFLNGEPPPPTHVNGMPDTWHLQVTMHTAFFGTYVRKIPLTRKEFLRWEFSPTNISSLV